MVEDFDVHGRIMQNIKETDRLVRWVLKLPGSDKNFYRRLLSKLLPAIEESSRPMPRFWVLGERISSIAKRLKTDPRVIQVKIVRRRKKGLKIAPLWRDDKGLIFPPGIFEGEKIRYRSPNKKRRKK